MKRIKGIKYTLGFIDINNNSESEGIHWSKSLLQENIKHLFLSTDYLSARIQW